MTLIMSRAIAALSTVRGPRSTACCCRRNRGDRSLTWARLAAFWEADGQLPPILGRNPKTLFTRARRLPGHPGHLSCAWAGINPASGPHVAQPTTRSDAGTRCPAGQTVSRRTASLLPASWQLPGPDFHRQATTSLRTRRSTGSTSRRHLRSPGRTKARARPCACGSRWTGSQRGCRCQPRQVT
jgi:hypothetical protein